MARHGPGWYNVLLDSQTEGHLGSIEHLFVFVARVGLDQTEWLQFFEQVLDVFGRDVRFSLLADDGGNFCRSSLAIQARYDQVQQPRELYVGPVRAPSQIELGLAARAFIFPNQFDPATRAQCNVLVRFAGGVLTRQTGPDSRPDRPGMRYAILECRHDAPRRSWGRRMDRSRSISPLLAHPS